MHLDDTYLHFSITSEISCCCSTWARAHQRCWSDGRQRCPNEVVEAKRQAGAVRWRGRRDPVPRQARNGRRQYPVLISKRCSCPRPREERIFATPARSGFCSSCWRGWWHCEKPGLVDALRGLSDFFDRDTLGAIRSWHHCAQCHRKRPLSPVSGQLGWLRIIQFAQHTAP